MPKFSPQNGTVSESEAHSYAVIRDCIHKALSLTRAQNIVTIDTKNETLMSLGLVVRFPPTSDYASVQQGGPPIRCGPLIPHVIGSEPTGTHHQTARPSRLLRRTHTHTSHPPAPAESPCHIEADTNHRTHERRAGREEALGFGSVPRGNTNQKRLRERRNFNSENDVACTTESLDWTNADLPGPDLA